MTRAEHYAIIRALENVENREKKMCEEFVKLNPAYKEQRERDRDNFLLAIMHARYEINRLLAE